MVVLGEGGVPYERGTPVPGPPRGTASSEAVPRGNNLKVFQNLATKVPTRLGFTSVPHSLDSGFFEFSRIREQQNVVGV